MKDENGKMKDKSGFTSTSHEHGFFPGNEHEGEEMNGGIDGGTAF